MSESRNITGVSSIAFGSQINRFNQLCLKLKTKNLRAPEVSREIEECMKEMTRECKAGLTATYVDSKNRLVFENVINILSRYVAPSDYIASLNSTVFSILNFIAEVLKDESFRVTLRNDFGLLQILADILGPSLGLDDLDIVLTCIELLTRGFVATWKAPYLRVLIDRLFSFILAKVNDSSRVNVVLQILINICRRSVSCVTLAHEDPRNKKVWDALRSCFGRESRNSRQEVLISHFLYLSTPNIPRHEFLSGYEVVRSAMQHLLDDFDKSFLADSVQFLDTISGMMCSIGEKFKSVYDCCETSRPGSPESNAIRDAKSKYIEIIESTISLLEQFVESHDTLDRQFEASIVAYIMSAIPFYVPVKAIIDAYFVGLKINDKIFSRSTHGVTYNTCIKYYLFMAERIIDGPDRQDFERHLLAAKYKEIEQVLFRAVSNINFAVGSNHSQAVLELTTILARLLSLLAKHSNFSEKVLEKLETETLKTTLRSLISPIDIKESNFYQRSLCIVEVLYLMAQYTRETTIFNLVLQQMNNPEVSHHIANCVLNGDEKTVIKALHVSGCVGFSQNNLASVSRNIISLRSLPASTILEIPDSNIALNSYTGVKRINDVVRTVNALEQFEIPDNTERTSGDVIFCYQMKLEMLETELTTLNTQINQLNKSRASMELLIKKQFELLSTGVLDQDKNQMEIIQLQRKINQTTFQSESDRISMTKELGTLRESLETQKHQLEQTRKTLEEKEMSFQQLEADLKATKKLKNEAIQQAKSYRHDKNNLSESLEKTKSALESMSAKCSGMEKELLSKQEELSNTLLQLEQQKQVVNTIRSVLGQNTFGGLLSQNS